MKVLFIGAGFMGQAMISGMITNKVISAADIYIYEISENVRNNVISKFNTNIQKEINSSISKFDIIILAIKPQVFHSFDTDVTMSQLKRLVTHNQLIVSIMAGIKIQKIESFFNNKLPIIRIMPNLAALIGKSMSVMTASTLVTETQLQIVKNICDAIGLVEIIEEKYFDAVTGLSGSGPAYIFTMIDAMIQGGILCGLNKQIAEKLVIQTILGAANMITNERSVEQLKYMVTSPAGTTIHGLAELEKNNFRSAVIEAIRAAYNRAKELNQD